MHPVRQQVYTLAAIYNELELRDSPYLCFYKGEIECVIQNSHIGSNLSDLPEWQNIRFKYIRETSEWIPIFRVVEADTDKLIALLDIEPNIESDGSLSLAELWVVPKAFPREQYYADKRKSRLQQEADWQKELDAEHPIYVEDDAWVGGREWSITFSDKTQLVVRENFDTTPPSYDRVSGDFTAKQIAAIEKWSALKVN